MHLLKVVSNLPSPEGMVPTRSLLCRSMSCYKNGLVEVSISNPQLVEGPTSIPHDLPSIMRSPSSVGMVPKRLLCPRARPIRCILFLLAHCGSHWFWPDKCGNRVTPMGIWPVKSLSKRSNSPNKVSMSNFYGIEPLSKLRAMLRTSKFARFPISVGSFPVSSFDCTSIYKIVLWRPISRGTKLCSTFSWTPKWAKRWLSKISAGIVPVNWFTLKYSSCSNAVNNPNSAGILS